MKLLSRVPKGYDFIIISETVIFIYATNALSPRGVIIYSSKSGNDEYFHVKDATYSAKLNIFNLIDSDEKSTLYKLVNKTI